MNKGSSAPRNSRGPKSFGGKSAGNKSYGDKPYGNRSEGGKSYGDKPYGNRSEGGKSYGDKPYGNRSEGGKSYGDKPYGNRSEGGKSYGDKPYGNRSEGGKSYGGNRLSRVASPTVISLMATVPRAASPLATSRAIVPADQEQAVTSPAPRHLARTPRQPSVRNVSVTRCSQTTPDQPSVPGLRLASKTRQTALTARTASVCRRPWPTPESHPAASVKK